MYSLKSFCGFTRGMDDESSTWLSFSGLNLGAADPVTLRFTIVFTLERKESFFGLLMMDAKDWTCIIWLASLASTFVSLYFWD